MSKPTPTFQVIDTVIEKIVGGQIFAALIVHEGQMFHIRFQANTALNFSGQLESAFQEAQADLKAKLEDRK